MGTLNITERKRNKVRIGDMSDLVFIFNIQLQTSRSQHAHNTKHKVIDKQNEIWSMLIPINSYELSTKINIDKETTHKLYVNKLNLENLPTKDTMIRDMDDYIYEFTGLEIRDELYIIYLKIIGKADTSYDDHLVIAGEKLYY